MTDAVLVIHRTGRTIPMGPITMAEHKARRAACEACDDWRGQKCRLMGCGSSCDWLWRSPMAKCPAGKWE